MIKKLIFILIGIGLSLIGFAQDLHFSQSFNQPMLYNPAQTALMPDADYRVSSQYRSQWGQLPVPYKTIAAAGDLKVLANQHKNSWLGLGLSFFNDKAGHGDLSLTKTQLTAAYHLQINETSIFSAGIGLGMVQRSVDISKLSFDNQWNGLKFDREVSTGETNAYEKVSYFDASIGLSYAYASSESFFFQVSAGVMHVNQPIESFYEKDNRIKLRPVVELRNVILLSDDWIGEWGIHASQQQHAYEIVAGGQVATNLTPRAYDANVLIAGAYYRYQDAVIPMVGYEWNKLRLLMSFDIPLSGMSTALRGYGGMEVSLVFKGLYEGGSSRNSGRKSYGCPRF